MSILILAIISSCIVLAIQAKRTATATEADNALLRTHLARVREQRESIDVRLVEAEMDRLEIEDLIASLDEEIDQ